MKQPEFWKHQGDLSLLLRPFAYLYTKGVRLRQVLIPSYRAEIPVVCIGNVTVGGAGKTPTALALGTYLAELGQRPAFLSRGYGTSHHTPVQVDVHHHTAEDVGDEPLLLARIAPTFVCRDRIAAVQAAVRQRATIAIMDDGFQNPSLHKDVSILVIDGTYGIGNGHVLPSGPLREPLSDAMARADAVFFIGEDRHTLLPQLTDKPLFKAQVQPTLGHLDKGKTYIAFAGLAHPEKFFLTLEKEGFTLAVTHSFPDHYAYTDQDIEELKAEAKEENAVLITTDKDYVRLSEAQRKEIEILPITLEFEDKDGVLALLTKLWKR